MRDFIKKNWDNTVRLEREDKGTHMGLPYEYFVPSIKDAFQDMFYWDTFFASKGLYLCGREALVKSTVENMFYMVDKFGYMPNGSNVALLGRSQPPFLSEMVKDLYGIYRDKVWLFMAYGILCKEYSFWEAKRTTETGLARYGYNMDEGNIKAYADMIRKRLPGLDFSGMSDYDIVDNVMSDAESGWDFNPRCEMKQASFNKVDLNSILYSYEHNMEYFARELGLPQEEEWKKRAEKRYTLMQELMFDGKVFLDYNFKEKKHSEIFSCASFYPLWAGIATKEQAESTVAELHRLECEFGVAVCENGKRNAVYQWDYPNGWAPLHYIVVFALMRYGYKEDALRIACKYVKAIEDINEKTGALWEKYNVVEGTTNVKDEYKMPEMLGWTAGIYLVLKDLIENSGE